MIYSFVLTGFLGSGKTTLLQNTIKQHFSDKRVAVVVNEFGDIGLDGKVLENVYSEVLEISEGCICCKLAEEFEAGVREIIAKYDPEIIFVETSGASEPFPIFLSLQNLGIVVEGIICVCDVKHFDTYKENATAKYQIGGSNILALSKTDLVSPQELEAVKEEIVAIKEAYDIRNNLTGEKIFKSYTMVQSVNGALSEDIFSGIYQIDDLQGASVEPAHEAHIARSSLSQQVAYLSREVTFEEMEKLLDTLPSNLYRVKSIVRIKGVEKPLFINYAFGDGNYEEIDHHDGKSLIVFIGEDVQKAVQTLKERFDFLTVPSFFTKPQQ